MQVGPFHQVADNANEINKNSTWFTYHFSLLISPSSVRVHPLSVNYANSHHSVCLWNGSGLIRHKLSGLQPGPSLLGTLVAILLLFPCALCLCFDMCFSLFWFPCVCCPTSTSCLCTVSRQFWSLPVPGFVLPSYLYPALSVLLFQIVSFHVLIQFTYSLFVLTTALSKFLPVCVFLLRLLVLWTTCLPGLRVLWGLPCLPAWFLFLYSSFNS